MAAALHLSSSTSPGSQGVQFRVTNSGCRSRTYCKRGRPIERGTVCASKSTTAEQTTANVVRAPSTGTASRSGSSIDGSRDGDEDHLGDLSAEGVSEAGQSKAGHSMAASVSSADLSQYEPVSFEATASLDESQVQHTYVVPSGTVGHGTGGVRGHDGRQTQGPWGHHPHGAHEKAIFTMGGVALGIVAMLADMLDLI